MNFVVTSIKNLVTFNKPFGYRLGKNNYLAKAQHTHLVITIKFLDHYLTKRSFYFSKYFSPHTYLSLSICLLRPPIFISSSRSSVR